MQFVCFFFKFNSNAVNKELFGLVLKRDVASVSVWMVAKRKTTKLIYSFLLLSEFDFYVIRSENEMSLISQRFQFSLRWKLCIVFGWCFFWMRVIHFFISNLFHTWSIKNGISVHKPHILSMGIRLMNSSETWNSLATDICYWLRHKCMHT